MSKSEKKPHDEGYPMMSSIDEQILRAAKEIAVKFIETGRISPAGFHDSFKSIYSTVEEAVKKIGKTPEPADDNQTRKP